MRSVGLHIRLNNSLIDGARKAIELGLETMQCFFVSQTSNKIMRIDEREQKEFLALRRNHFGNLYHHGSYWINLAGIDSTGYRPFTRELTIAKRLEFTHMVLHSGAAKGGITKMDGIDALVRMLNKITKQETDIQLILENTTHGGLSVGSDITDFYHVLQKLDYPERISFCIDTAHAFAYGYDIAKAGAEKEFIELLRYNIGLEKIVLIHLNDTRERCGSRIDRHLVVGEGAIGTEALKSFVTHHELCHIPIIMEPPAVSHEKEKKVLEMVKSWH